MKPGISPHISPAMEHKLALLVREGKPSQPTVLVVRDSPGQRGSGIALARAAIAYLGHPCIPVSSKYIGETEKNLGRKFEEAERRSAVLLIEDADALFSRSTRTGGGDPYANQEISYLLSGATTRKVMVVLVGNRIPKAPVSGQRQIRWIELG